MKMHIKPKLFSSLKDYSVEKCVKDVKAGFLVAIISLPMSMAFAISSGLGPEQGVFTAIIGGILIGFLGGSNVQIAGPTGAFLMVIQTTIADYGMTGLYIATIMAGLMLILLGLLGIGKLIKYIPNSITLGFTRGIAVIIFTSQIADFIGLDINNPQIKFIDKWKSYIDEAGTCSLLVAVVGILSLAFMFLWPKINKSIPSSCIVLVVVSVVVWMLDVNVPILGDIKEFPDKPIIDSLSLELIGGLIRPSITITILVSLQALLSAVVTDGLIQDKHNPSAELVAQGFANIACGLMGCMPSTGGVARSITNAKSGAKTPIAAISNGLVLLGFMLFLLPIIKYIPKAALAAIIVYITYNMFNFKEFILSLKKSRLDLLIMMATFLLTVTVSLTMAIMVGMILSGVAKVVKKRRHPTYQY